MGKETVNKKRFRTILASPKKGMPPEAPKIWISCLCYGSLNSCLASVNSVVADYYALNYQISS